MHDTLYFLISLLDYFGYRLSTLHIGACPCLLRASLSPHAQVRVVEQYAYMTQPLSCLYRLSSNQHNEPNTYWKTERWESFC